MADAAVTKVMHAASGDLAAFVLHFDARPPPSTTRSSRPASPASAARCRWSGCWTRSVGVKLQHDEGFTDWQKRPLTETQVEYAADDVQVPAGCR